MKYRIFGVKHNNPTIYTLVTIEGPKAKEIVDKMLIDFNDAILQEWIDEPFAKLWMMEVE